jgi:hypothetical protein
MHEVTIHKIKNIFTSELDLIEQTKVDEFYIDEKLMRSVTYDIDDRVTASSEFIEEDGRKIIYKNTIFEEGSEKVEFVKTYISENGITICTSSPDKIEEAVNISNYMDNELTDQMFITEDGDVTINYHKKIDDKTKIMEQYLFQEKILTIKSTKEENGTVVITYDKDGKVVDRRVEINDNNKRIKDVKDYNGKNELVGEAEFLHDQRGKRVFDFYWNNELNKGYIKKYITIGTEENATYIENIYNYNGRTEWEMFKKIMPMDLAMMVRIEGENFIDLTGGVKMTLKEKIEIALENKCVLIEPENIDAMPIDKYMVYILSYDDKAIVVGHGEKKRAKIIFDNINTNTSGHIKSILVRIYHLFGEEEKFQRFIIPCVNKEEAKEIEKELHNQIGGNTTDFPERFRDKLFADIGDSFTQTILNIALESSFDGLADLKKWKNEQLVPDVILERIWDNLKLNEIVSFRWENL